jgi:hypothetical protein
MASEPESCTWLSVQKLLDINDIHLGRSIAYNYIDVRKESTSRDYAFGPLRPLGERCIMKHLMYDAGSR